MILSVLLLRWAWYANQCSENTSHITPKARTMVTTLHTPLDLVRDFVNMLDIETGVDAIGRPTSSPSWLSDNGLVDDLVEPTKASTCSMPSLSGRRSGQLLQHNGGEC